MAAGLRREYRSLDIIFVAHTTEAWEFSEADFFQVTGSGGTVASTGLNKVREIMQTRFSPVNCNVYLFYASDGDNASDDRDQAREALDSLAKMTRYAGYVEISTVLRSTQSELSRLFDAVSAAGAPSGRSLIRDTNDVVSAVRYFFTRESQSVAANTGRDSGPPGAAP